MKKLVLILSIACVAFNQVNAQQATESSTNSTTSFISKNGHQVLPQAGDWSIGFSASSFLGYAGNLLNGNTANNAGVFANANAPAVSTLGNIGGIAFVGKYMADANTAYRVRFQANSYLNKRQNYVLENNLTPNPLLPTYVKDEESAQTNAFLIGAGLEKRRGQARLQGVYGAELIIGVLSENYSYTYGNAMDLNFNTPLSTTNFSGGFSSNVSSRVLSRNNGAQFFAGARGYIGAEYFFAPKMSIGAEIGYTLGFQTNGDQSVVSETYDSGNLKTVQVESKTFRNSGLRSFGIGLDNVNAGLNLFLYF
ncbi:MAG: hypothetical protein H3C45_00600 [Bacteroidia bacterium]|nr:hypothetical protein [Bacteroidia bacterium]